MKNKIEISLLSKVINSVHSFSVDNVEKTFCHIEGLGLLPPEKVLVLKGKAKELVKLVNSGTSIVDEGYCKKFEILRDETATAFGLNPAEL